MALPFGNDGTLMREGLELDRTYGIDDGSRWRWTGDVFERVS